MNRRIAFATLSVALVLGSAGTAHAFFGMLGGNDGCCCEASCACEEPSCCCEQAPCCEPSCCCERPWSPRCCGLFGGFRGLFPRNHGCCEASCACEQPSCCCEEPACACEPSCGCEPSCCGGRRGCFLLDGLCGLFRGRNDCCCEASCECEPSCGCNY